MLLLPKLVRMETYNEFYSNGIVTLCNLVSPDMRDDHLYSIFVAELEDLYLSMFKNVYNSISDLVYIMHIICTHCTFMILIQFLAYFYTCDYCQHTFI